jgi:alpha-mannosidase
VRLRTVILVLIAFVLAGTALHTETLPNAQTGEQLFNGFARQRFGQTIDYHSFHPFARTALLSRCTNGKQTIQWETDPLPPSPGSPFITFVWIAGHSTGSSRADASFRLALNGRECLTFATAKDRRVRQWTVEGKEGVRLSFDAQWEDGAEDLFGYAYLRVPAQAFPAGKPLLVSVTGDSANRPDWFMTFTHAFRESLSVQPEPALLRGSAGSGQLIDVLIDHLGTAGQADILIPGQPRVSAPLALGFNRIPLVVPPVRQRVETTVTVILPGRPEERFPLTLDPVTLREFWLLPHSHNDIGYSDLQVDVEKKQLRNIRDALRLFRKTSGYPDEARFRWNTEILWAVESFLATCTADERRDFGEAVRGGGIGLNALYANQLTGICRPEELLRLTDYARRLEKLLGVTIDDAMITDIPGCAWATAPVLSQAGIKYFSSGPNLMPFTPILGDRVGYFNLTWGDRPFYWISPSGKDRVLFWTAGKGYSWFADWINGRAGPKTAPQLFDYLRELEKQHYPYDMVQLRYTVAGDNGPVDADLPAFVKAWNERYATPRLVIATASRMFHEFERRWGSTLPSYAGEITPYWEDGALSTLRELGIVRHVSERLVQAEALACLRPERRDFRDTLAAAWRNVTLFDEHTWGAHNSIAEPDSPFVLSQWRVKKQYALDAERQSSALMAGLLAPAGQGNDVEVINTLSWTRTGLVTLSAGESSVGDRVTDDRGKVVPSQRLSTGELVFLANDLPPVGGKRFSLLPGKASAFGGVTAAENTLRSSSLSLVLDTSTGAIRSLRTKEGRECVDTAGGGGANRYLYVAGFDPAAARENGCARIEVVERGPLVGRLRVTSQAPGTRSLVQEITLVHGSSRVALRTTIDKLPIRSKEGVHVAFPFLVPDGTIRMDAGWGVLTPETDQLPGACRDFLSAGRWVDLSGKDHGITLTLLESPLVELGAMTDETPNSKLYRIWRTTLAPGKTIYSYVMNNYWHTNSAAYQDGPASLHYSLIPHGTFNAAATYRAGVEESQPLLVRRAGAGEHGTSSLFRVESPGVAVTSLMHSRDGKATMVRLYNAGEKAAAFDIRWLGFRPTRVFVSTVDEIAGTPAPERFSLPPYGILTLRCER